MDSNHSLMPLSGDKMGRSRVETGLFFGRPSFIGWWTDQPPLKLYLDRRAEFWAISNNFNYHPAGSLEFDSFHSM